MPSMMGAAESNTDYVEMGGQPSTSSWNFLYLDDCNFKKYARKLSISLVFVMFLVPLLPGIGESLVSDLPNLMAHLATAVVIGILELPFCCTSMRVCQRMQRALVVFEVYWLRGCLYIVLGITLGLVCWFLGVETDWLAWSLAVLLCMCGVLYILATLNGEFYTSESDSGEQEAQAANEYARSRLIAITNLVAMRNAKGRTVLDVEEGGGGLRQEAARAALSTTL